MKTQNSDQFLSRESNLVVTQKCSKGHISERRSHPKIKGGMSTGSLLLSSAVLFTGNTYTRIKEFIDVATYIFSLKEHL